MDMDVKTNRPEENKKELISHTHDSLVITTSFDLNIPHNRIVIVQVFTRSWGSPAKESVQQKMRKQQQVLIVGSVFWASWLERGLASQSPSPLRLLIRDILNSDRACLQMRHGHGSKPVPPVNIPIPTKIG